MDLALILENKVFIRVEELLIICAIEAVVIEADVFSSLNSNRTLPLGPPPGSHPTWKSLKVLAPMRLKVPWHCPTEKSGLSISSPSLCHCE